MGPQGLSLSISRLIFTEMVFTGRSIIFQVVFSPVFYILFLNFLLLSFKKSTFRAFLIDSISLFLSLCPLSSLDVKPILVFLQKLQI